MARKKRISITDIAKASGLSITTVSFILNGKAKERRISEASTRRVLDYVKKVGYKPSQLIRNGAGSQVRVLAILIDDIANPLFLSIRKHLERIAFGAGYQLIYTCAEGDEQKTQQFVRLCLTKEIDGVIMSHCEGVEDALLRLKKQHIPVVLFDGAVPMTETSYVISDDRQGGREATKHLLVQGFGRVGFVSLYSNRKLLDGYMDAMDKFQKQAFIRKFSDEYCENGSQIVEFVRENKLEAVVFASPYLAISGLRGFKEQADTLPPMIVCGDHELFSLHTPSISVVVSQTELLAEKLMETMDAAIQGKLEEARKIVLPCELLVRESSIAQPV